MDDYLESCESVRQAKELIHQVISINKAANWEMHSFASNEIEIQNTYSEKNSTEKSIKIGETIEKPERILGLQWLTDTDELTFRIENVKVPLDLLNGNRVSAKY